MNTSVKDGDILFVRSNGNPDLVGRSVIVPPPSEPTTFSGFTIRGRIEDETVLPLFYAYLFKSRDFAEMIKTVGQGANIRNLSHEIISGLEHINAHKKTTAFLEFVSMNRVLPLTEQSVTISAGIYAELRKTGKPLDDIDLLIAGVAIANNRVLVTHNRSHFERIDRLEVEDWSEEQTAGR